MSLSPIVVGSILSSPIYPEQVRVVSMNPVGQKLRLGAVGLATGTYHERLLSAEQLLTIRVSPSTAAFDGDAAKFKLGIEANRLALAYDYDPFFSLSIAKVDPLPHQLEAVYDYFLRLPRIRFLLADDPGAGKTIMAGLLLKELKIRGLVSRTLIVTPANLTFQWQREMKDRFREQFCVMRGERLRSDYGINPWQEESQVITSVSWVSRVKDAKESLLRAGWDMIIVDEAHKMSPTYADKSTLAYELGQELSDRTAHLLLMTATPHKGDQAHFCRFLALLDRDVYADVSSLQDAFERCEAPFYLRRTKEALYTFPDPETGEVHRIFTKRNVETVPFTISRQELDFYDALRRYVERQSVMAKEDESARGRALGFNLAMLQRRFASSVHAVRRSLERMRDKRQKILDDPVAYQAQQAQRQVPDDFDDLTDEEQQEVLEQVEEAVASFNALDLKLEIDELTRLIEQAKELEREEEETKLRVLRDQVGKHGVFADPQMKLLLFTEHKDTLDYLVGKLQGWGLKVVQIHGSMKIGDLDTPNTRLWAERQFREEAQVLVATEAAGEGINLQFCWFMINYDIPWNPVRLEQRMGRIHRYGQPKDCLVLNFVSESTVEGRVLQRLLERIAAIEADLDPERTGKVFNVIGEVLAPMEIERLLREMYVHNQTEESITKRIVEMVDTEKLRHITDSALEGLAKRDINLAGLFARKAEARERRLVPEVVEEFFTSAAPVAGVSCTTIRNKPHFYRVSSLPRPVRELGARNEHRFGKLGHDYKQVVFDKELLTRDATAEWVTPGHPLFEALRCRVEEAVAEHLQRGAVFYDLAAAAPYRLDVYRAAVRDGRNSTLRESLYVAKLNLDGSLEARQPTIFLDLVAAPGAVDLPSDQPSRDENAVLEMLLDKELNPALEQLSKERTREVEMVRSHVTRSLNALIARESRIFCDLDQQRIAGQEESGLAGRLEITQNKIDELNQRLEGRMRELEQERQLTIVAPQLIGRAWVLPHPDRAKPEISPMVPDAEVERIAVQAVTAFEEARGWRVESVEAQNRGFDLISRGPHPVVHEADAYRFIEVKGRAGVGGIALSENEYKTAQRLGKDYWLYVVYNCSTAPEVHPVQDPATCLEFKPVQVVQQYVVDAKQIIGSTTEDSK